MQTVEYTYFIDPGRGNHEILRLNASPAAARAGAAALRLRKERRSENARRSPDRGCRDERADPDADERADPDADADGRHRKI